MYVYPVGHSHGIVIVRTYAALRCTVPYHTVLCTGLRCAVRTAMSLHTRNRAKLAFGYDDLFAVLFEYFYVYIFQNSFFFIFLHFSSLFFTFLHFSSFFFIFSSFYSTFLHFFLFVFFLTFHVHSFYFVLFFSCYIFVLLVRVRASARSCVSFSRARLSTVQFVSHFARCSFSFVSCIPFFFTFMYAPLRSFPLF